MTDQAITQCKSGDELLPWDEQEGKHRLLFLKSGRFRHAQYRWPIVDKEAYAFGEVLTSLSHWINGGRYPAAFFTDHANLVTIFDSNARQDGCSKPNAQRCERWALAMRALWYQIMHIDGENNCLPDLGTRWGNRFLAKPVAKKGLRLGPRLLARTMLSSRRHGQVTRKCALRLDPPKLVCEVVPPDVDADECYVLPRLTDMVDRKYLAKQQRKHASMRPAGLKQVDGEQGRGGVDRGR